MATHTHTTEAETPATVETVQDRINQFAAWYEIEPVKLSDPNDPTIDEVLDWTREAGASLDWICCADIKAMATAYRDARLMENRASKSFRKLSDPEAAALLFVMQLTLDEGLELKPALEMWKAECAKRREEAA